MGGHSVCRASRSTSLSGSSAEATLELAREELGARVQERTAALDKINHQLQAEVAERSRWKKNCGCE